jgi:glycosyltransferase involved in cell wall biosynthesis
MHPGDTLLSMKEATIVIPARNASATVERAIASALEQGDYPLLLIDDFSQDDTVARAKKLAGTRLSIVRPSEHRTLGFARQAGLDAVKTPFLVWSDADDELLPGRVDRLVEAMKRERTDIAADGAEIVDGATGRLTGISRIPAFLREAQPPVREFERNYLPGDGVAAFRTRSLARLGYDAVISSDMDVILRAIVAGYRFSLLDEIGYRIHAYPRSLSRFGTELRRTYQSALLKHSYERVRQLYLQAPYNPRITAWGLVSMALFRQEYEPALSFVGEAAGLMTDPAEIIEPDGPMPLPEGWRAGFYRGTILLLMNRDIEARLPLEQAEAILSTPEGNNNLGVALFRSGEKHRARTCFENALTKFPDFLDARTNLESEEPCRITSHPLRTLAFRKDYSAASIV